MAQTTSKEGIRDGLGHVHLYMFQNVIWIYNGTLGIYLIEKEQRQQLETDLM
jgi:hypothetical protein